MGVPTPADKRFRRAHVKLGRRRRVHGLITRGARVLLLAALLAYAGYRAADLIRGAGGLAVNQIVVKGNERLSTGEVLALVENLRGQNILAVRLEEWQRRLVASPWVERATLRRVLPSTVEIEVTERRPLGIARLAGQLYLVDESGVIIDDYGPQYAEFDLPIIDGLSREPTPAKGTVDQARTALAARLLAEVSVRRDLAQRVSQIDIRDDGDAVVILDGDRALIHLGNEQFVERLQSYLELAPALRARVPEIDYVDLRFDGRVYVRPAQRKAGDR